MYPLNSAPTTKTRLTAAAAGALLLGFATLGANVPWPDEDHSPRRSIPLDDGWRSTASEDDAKVIPDFEKPGFDDSGWKTVSVPHNWDGYEGFRQAKHGVFHGSAWYRRNFDLEPADAGRQVFLMFEGIGSYATVWVNGKLIGHHGGGLLTFTFDITHAVDYEGANTLAVRADHPSGIRDLPWVCGGCELTYGFSEGTQPFGISRPAHVIITDSLRVEPFGVHIWNDETISAEAAVVHTRTTIRNYSADRRDFTLVNRVLDAMGGTVAEMTTETFVRPGATTILGQDTPTLHNPRLWSPDDPYLYTMETVVKEGGEVVDRIINPFGIRWIEWPDIEGPIDQPLLLNGEPFFINGVADYEHIMGNSHAFTDEEVLTRIRKIQAAGFNAFRDAHHPHNLRFQRFVDREGMLWWTQNGAQIWFDNENFQANFKALVRDWIRERRNSPSLILYGLQNESKLPVWFTKENVAIIREMDPTASIQRLVASCNGGEGTDWDIPQNWTGTYGGDPTLYAEDLRHQRLVGEYGAWRNLEHHDEGEFKQDGPHTEPRMNLLMEMKVHLAETVRDKVIGHFMWPFTTHQNPGRNVGNRGTQTRDGIREFDRIGPANNKGLQTIWGELLDVYYMYRSNYAPADTEPMVYIASHTWPDRWTEPGRKDGIRVYSNADEVELFNDYKGGSLGTRARGEPGTHFRWDDVPVETNLLYAEARVGGETVATDLIKLHHLPRGPGWESLKKRAGNPTAPLEGRNYLFRVNAGGPDYTDTNGNVWQADNVYREGDSWGSRSWASAYPNLHPVFGSKRKIYDPVADTRDDLLFQSFRYGRDELDFVFHVPDGKYTVELYFVEPWYGTGGGLDATGWRIFDVAVNGETVIENLDIWTKVGRAHAFRKDVQANAVDGKLIVSFPRVLSTQAVISAIAVSTDDASVAAPPRPDRLIQDLAVFDAANARKFAALTWADTGMRQYGDRDHAVNDLAWEVREAEWIRTAQASHAFDGDELMHFTVRDDADVFVAHDPAVRPKPEWLRGWDPTGYTMTGADAPERPLELFRRGFEAGETVVLGANGTAPGGDARMYSVIVQERRPPPPAEQIHGLAVENSRAPEGWRAVGNFSAGRDQYTDGGPVLVQFPNMFSDADWIQTAQADAANPALRATFQVEDHLEVLVALDERIAEKPDWIKGWLETPHTVVSAPGDDYRFRLYRERFGPGDTARLGPNPALPGGGEARMYSVLTRTIRAAQYYPAEELEFVEGTVRTDVPGYSGGGYLDLTDTDSDTFDWIISVDAGDRYNFNFRYTMAEPVAFTADYEIIDREGRVVCGDTVTFDAPSAPGEWIVSRNRTCNSINAGTYIIRLSSPYLPRLLFDELEVE